MEYFIVVVSNHTIVLSLVSGLILALVGSIAARRHRDRERMIDAVSSFGKKISTPIPEIESTPQNDPTIVIEKYIATAETDFAVCSALLDRSNRLRFTQLWEELKCKDKDGNFNYQIDSWTDKDGETTPEYRKKVVNRLHKIIAFEIKN
jgi:hypothetical protein